MKRKILLATICAGLQLTACGGNDQAAEETVSTAVSEQESPEAEEGYTKLDDYSVLTEISMDDVLLECTLEEPKENYSFCIVLRNGNVYCANLYGNSVQDSRYSEDELSEDKLPYLRDIYYVGRVSSDELEKIANWIEQKESDQEETVQDVPVKRLNKEQLLQSRFLYVNGKSGSGMELIWMPQVSLAPYDGYKQLGMECHGGSGAAEIVQWFGDSDYMDAWNRHIIETGPDMNPEVESAYVATIDTKLSGDYPGNELFLISTEEELRYMENSMGFDPKEFETSFRSIREQYPIDSYDYLLKVNCIDFIVCNWKQNADSLRIDNGYLYFNYDLYGDQKQRADVMVWLNEPRAYIDIAVVAKNSIDTEISAALPAPQDMQLHPMAERSAVVVN